MTTKRLEEILSKENLEKACTAVVRNNGASGIDGMKVDELKDTYASMARVSHKRYDKGSISRWRSEEYRYQSQTEPKETLGYLR